MSTIFGDCNHDFESDPHLKAAHNKLLDLVRLCPNGCWYAPPIGPTEMVSRFMVNKDYDLTRRWSWRIYNGPIPEGHRIFVACGNRHCVNPRHLVARKADPKPKRPRRIVRPNAKLTWADVEQIRASNESNAELARRFGVHLTTIGDIRLNKTWVKR